MDQRIRKLSSHKIKIIATAYQIPTGLSINTPATGEVDDKVTGIIKDRKQNKLFSKQDKLALISAHRAFEKSGIAKKDPDYSEKTGVYYCVGTLPFEDRPLEKLAEQSQVDGKLNYQAFSTEGFNSLNPMLTFKCLPNMPLFHISYNLNITGRYFMTYPGTLDLFSALKRAIADLEEGIIKYAIVGAACDQKNFLVKHHLKRTQPEYADLAIDCSAAMILTLDDSFEAIAEIDELTTNYQGYDPFSQKIILQKNNPLPAYCGPVTSLLYLNLMLENSTENSIEYSWEGNKNQTAFIKIRREK